MYDFFWKLFNDDSLSPHGICLLWRPELIWTHATSDMAIGLSYVSISVFLAYVLSRRPDIKFGWVVWCFAVFILACGATHFFSLYTLWQPEYGLEALVKVVTAGASIATAVLLWPLLPKALAWPSPEQLALANHALRVSVQERDAALADLRKEVEERAHVEAMLRQSQKMEALGHLTGGMAHDFNNIMSIIVMNLGRMRKQLGPAASEDVQRSIRHASEAVERGASLTNRLLTFSRQSEVQKTRVEPDRTLAAITPLLLDAAGPDRKLNVDASQGLPALDIDVVALENALLNLVINARDATTPGGHIMVSARYDADQAAIRFDVKDDGCGMSRETQERAFDPFFTTKPVGQGSGLGLSQVFGFATAFGGDVAISSAPGAGTTISISLPRASDE
jgi:signal transduction histidine kinase